MQQDRTTDLMDSPTTIKVLATETRTPKEGLASEALH